MSVYTVEVGTERIARTHHLDLGSENLCAIVLGICHCQISVRHGG